MIVDGYNVIGALDRYAPAATGGLDESRELLVNDALKAAGWTGRRIVVVFDAHGGPDPERTELRAGEWVRVVYSAPGESADDVIERLLGSLGASATLYTGDSPCNAPRARGASARHPRVRRPARRAPRRDPQPRRSPTLAHRGQALAGDLAGSKRSGGRINTPLLRAACQQMSCRRLRIKVNGSTC